MKGAAASEPAAGEAGSSKHDAAFEVHVVRNIGRNQRRHFAADLLAIGGKEGDGVAHLGSIFNQEAHAKRVGVRSLPQAEIARTPAT